MVFPTQGQAPESLEEVGVIDELADYLDSGTIQLFCTETIDDESWGGTGDAAERAQRQETYYHYVVDELVPLVAKMGKTKARPLALGFDAGATHGLRRGAAPPGPLPGLRLPLRLLRRPSLLRRLDGRHAL